MPAHLHLRLLSISLALYFVATWCSMAGMEIFGWLTFLFTMTYVVRKVSPVSIRDFGRYLPWKSCLLLLAITAIGLIIHRTEKTEFVQHFGSQRWMFLFFSSSIAIAILPPTLRGYRIFLIFTSIIAVYAVFQAATGIDLLRPGSNRAVQPMGLVGNTGMEFWRSAGPFGSPLGYGYIAGQHVCLLLAMALLTFKNRKQNGWLFWASLIAYVLVSFSLITTFTRGVWIAMTIAHLAVAWLVSKRIAGALMTCAATVAGVLFTLVDAFRLRVLSLFDMGYASNSERMFLWKANWEMFKDYPIFGIGYQENENRAGEYVARMGRPDAFTGHAHNNYLQMLSGTGITGFVTYLFIIGFMLWLNWRLIKDLPKEYLWPRALALGCFGAQLTLHIGGFTECNFKAGATSHNTMIVWAIVVALTVLLKRLPNQLQSLALNPR